MSQKTDLIPVCFISAGSQSTTAHFVVDAPSTSIVCLETLATAGGTTFTHTSRMGAPNRCDTYLVADPHWVTVKALILVAKGTSTAELTKLKSVTAVDINDACKT